MGTGVRAPGRSHSAVPDTGVTHGGELVGTGGEIEAAVLELVHEARTRAPLAEHWEHGERHWADVAAVGLWLAERDHRVNPLVVVLFAILHDAQRQNDLDDLAHAARGADLLCGLAPTILTSIADRAELAAVGMACAHHASGTVITSPTVGTAWDADRLLYSRGGVAVDPMLLSTPVASDPAAARHATQVLAGHRPSWSELIEQCGRLRIARDRSGWA